MQIFFIGPAGSGKTSLVKKFGEWLKAHSNPSLSYVNLDPGCLTVPYECDYDIRDHITIMEIMEKEKLGPSGAMLRGAELTNNSIKRIIKSIKDAQNDFVLIDTPGQSEIFVFQSAGPAICDQLKSISTTICVYVIDGISMDNGVNVAAALSLSLASRLRLGIPTVNVLNKSDLINNDRILEMFSDYNYLRKEIEEEEHGTIKGLALNFVRALKSLSTSQRFVKVSAKTGEGIGQLYDLINESFCECGDLS
jgi:GTPase SAR1 family protein